jgi:hypothetical protein
VGKTERYHAPLRRAWDILYAELSDTTSNEVNNTAGPNRLVPTLLVFRAYPRITAESLLSPLIIKRSKAIQKATKALRKLTTER